MATDTVRYTRSLGGYFRRFTGGLLSRWVRQDLLPPVRASRPGAAHHRPKKQNAALDSDAGSEPKVPRTEDEPPVPPVEEGTPSGEDVPTGVAADVAQAKGLGGPSTDAPDKGLITVEKIDPPSEVAKEPLTLAERATLAWLHVDRRIQSSKSLNVGGSTASVALLHSLDSPAQPWYSSKLLSITSIHIG